jgi:hypothetical protein
MNTALGIKALSADDFLSSLFQDQPEKVLDIVEKQAKNLRNPPQTVPEVLDTLNQHAPEFVALVRAKYR